MNLRWITTVLLFYYLVALNTLSAQDIGKQGYKGGADIRSSGLSGFSPTDLAYLQKKAVGGDSIQHNYDPLKPGKLSRTLNYDPNKLHLRNRIIPLDNSVYSVIEYFEAKGWLGFMPEAKPYTKGYIVGLFIKLSQVKDLSERERNIVQRYLTDLIQDSNGLAFYRQTTGKTFVQAGLNAEASARTGMGGHGTWSGSVVGEPYLSGDLGDHLTYMGSMGLAFERLSPDLFFQSYTRDKQVVFPYQAEGYSYLPYQFNFNTMSAHVLTSGNQREGLPVKDSPTAGMIYRTELNGSWFADALQFSINNQQRAWGFDQENLVLSSTARRFPGMELKIHPAPWIRYSFLTGSLFSYFSQSADYKKEIYGYDIGQVQKNFTYHLLEFIPNRWLQISAGGGNIWSKRLEMAYMIPFVLPHFTQIDVGDHDNTSVNLEFATQIPRFGKTWVSFFVDEFNFRSSAPLLKTPENRYAWQVGWKTTLLSSVIPATTSILKYTRVTPFTYTHYPDSVFNTSGGRPNDLSYTHDGFNLGFYLPPNSAELNWKLVNVAIPDLILTLNNRLIIHGTNDLASSNAYLIYGDVNKYLLSDVSKYPLMNFTKDGIYDWTVISEFKFDWKIRHAGLANYIRLVGDLGYSKTWWKCNQSGVSVPQNQILFTGNLGIIVEM